VPENVCARKLNLIFEDTTQEHHAAGPPVRAFRVWRMPARPSHSGA